MKPIMVVALGLSLIAAAVARATPPPAGTPDAEELSRFTASERAWIAQQHDMRGRFCCSEGDFAFVTIRQRGDVLEAMAKHPDPLRGIPNGWLPVEDERKVNLQGQTNVPDVIAAWYYNGHIQCILLGGAY